jgi:hypothetical protein
VSPPSDLIETSPYREIADARTRRRVGRSDLLSGAKTDLLRVGYIRWRLTMLGKLSIIAVVAAIIMILSVFRPSRRRH